jgi:hypothetical protein
MYQGINSKLKDTNERLTVEECLKQNGINLDDFDDKKRLNSSDESIGRREGIRYSRTRFIPTQNHILHPVELIESECSENDTIFYYDDAQRCPIQWNCILVIVTLVLFFMLVPLYVSGPYKVIILGTNLQTD